MILNCIPLIRYQVKIIGQSILEKDVFQTVADVINFETNLNIEQDNILGSGVNIQGISGQNVKILIDDVPVVTNLELSTKDTHELQVPQVNQRGYYVQFEIQGTGTVQEYGYLAKAGDLVNV